MRSALMALVVAAGTASAAVFTNGPYVTGAANGFGGANTSAIQAAPYNSFGYSVLAGTFAAADDFTVTDAGGWDLNSFTAYSYQTQANGNANNVSTLTTIRVAIFASNPIGTQNAPDFGDLVTNRTILSNVFSGTYRVTATTLTNSARAIMAISADMSDIPTLGPGTYFVAWSLGGTVASGPWAVPVTPSRANDNAMQRNISATPSNWALVDGDGTGTVNPLQDLAFDLDYTVIPAPGAAALLGLGGLLVARRRR